MARRYFVAAVLMVFGFSFFASFAPGAEDVLKLVPDSASGLLVIHKPGELDTKLQSLGREMKLPAIPLLPMLKQQFGLQGEVDENGTVAVIVLPPKDDGLLPTPILLIPVTDYDQFLKAFHVEKSLEEPVTEGRIFNFQCWVRHIGGYAAITDALHREALSIENLSVAKEIPPALATWREWLAHKDVAGLILPPGIHRISAKVQEGIGRMKAVFAQQIAAKDSDSNTARQPQQIAAAFDVYGTLCQKAEKEITACGFGLQIDKQNALRITNRATLASGGTLSRLVSQMRPAKGNLLANLPDEPFVAAGGVGLSEAMWAEMINGSLTLMKTFPDLYGLTEEQVNKLSELSTQSAAGVESMSILFGVGQSGKPAFANAVAVTRVENSKKFMTFYETAIRRYSDCIKDANSPILQPMEIENIQWDGVAALQITTNVPQPPSAADNPNHAHQMEALFGSDSKLVAWAVPADEHHVVIGYVDKEHVRRVVEAIKKGKGSLDANDAVTKTAALLPPNAAVVGYVSPAGLIEFIQQMKSTLLPPNAQIDLTLPAFPKTPPIGFAVTTGTDEVEKCLVIPVEFLQAVVPYAANVKAANMGAAEKEAFGQQK